PNFGTHSCRPSLEVFPLNIEGLPPQSQRITTPPLNDAIDNRVFDRDEMRTFSSHKLAGQRRANPPIDGRWDYYVEDDPTAPELSTHDRGSVQTRVPTTNRS